MFLQTFSSTWLANVVFCPLIVTRKQTSLFGINNVNLFYDSIYTLVSSRLELLRIEKTKAVIYHPVINFECLFLIFPTLIN